MRGRYVPAAAQGASFFGGVSLGLLTPIGLAFGEPLLAILGGAGAAAIALAYDNAAVSGPLPEQVEQRLRVETGAYQTGFQLAYRQRLAERRRQASIWGGSVGTATGLGLLGWLVWDIALLLLSACEAEHFGARGRLLPRGIRRL